MSLYGTLVVDILQVERGMLEQTYEEIFQLGNIAIALLLLRRSIAGRAVVATGGCAVVLLRAVEGRPGRRVDTPSCV
jgi:hypothetical protein